VVISLAGRASLRWMDLDTTWFVGNAPGAASVSVRTRTGDWVDVLAPQPINADTHNRFQLPAGVVADAVRIDVFPDGGISRVHIHGVLQSETLTALFARWTGSDPDPAVLQEVW
jgi:allantoicase